jgi:large subunit ribosomal protein L25
MDKVTLNVVEGAYAVAKEVLGKDCIPMNYYGKGVTNRQFCVDYQEFRRTYEKGGRSTIYTLKTDKGEEIPALVYEIQFDPITDAFHHIDLKAVNMDQTIRTQIPLLLTGVAPAVKDLGGVLVQSRDTVEVECLPKDLVHEIEVDITSLVDFHCTLNVGDIVAPTGITILDAPDINIAGVSAPRSAIEEEAPVAQEGEAAPAAAAPAEEKKEE